MRLPTNRLLPAIALSPRLVPVLELVLVRAHGID
jgi:hypothetical protein